MLGRLSNCYRQQKYWSVRVSATVGRFPRCHAKCKKHRLNSALFFVFSGFRTMASIRFWHSGVHSITSVRSSERPWSIRAVTPSVETSGSRKVPALRCLKYSVGLRRSRLVSFLRHVSASCRIAASNAALLSTISPTQKRHATSTAPVSAIHPSLRSLLSEQPGARSETGPGRDAFPAYEGPRPEAKAADLGPGNRAARALRDWLGSWLGYVPKTGTDMACMAAVIKRKRLISQALPTI